MAGQSEVVLHSYAMSSASWRVRIALAIKGTAHRVEAHDLAKGGQKSPAYLALNPQGLVPALEIDGLVLTQSLAIIEYLEERFPQPALIGSTPAERGQIRAFALAIACEIHPLQNLSVRKRIAEFKDDSGESPDWAHEVNQKGMEMCSKLLPADAGPFCFGDAPSLADILLIPQMANARRYGVDMVWKNLARIEAHCLALPAFAETAAARQPDYTG